MRLLIIETSSSNKTAVSDSRFFVAAVMPLYSLGASSSSLSDSSTNPAGRPKNASQVAPPATAAATPVGTTTRWPKRRPFWARQYSATQSRSKHVFPTSPPPVTSSLLLRLRMLLASRAMSYGTASARRIYFIGPP